MKYFILNIGLFFAVTAFSQKKWPGYIIKESGDTLWGSVKYDFYGLNYKKVYVYDKLGDEHLYPIEEVNGLGQIKKKVQKDYIKFKVNKGLFSNDEFLERLVNGKISIFIYQWEKGNGLHGTKYFLQNKAGKLWVVEMLLFSYNKNVLKEAFADCPEVLNDVKGNISDKDLISLAIAYNNCKN